jgi:hypothetical protein
MHDINLLQRGRLWRLGDGKKDLYLRRQMDSKKIYHARLRLVHLSMIVNRELFDGQRCDYVGGRGCQKAF